MVGQDVSTVGRGAIGRKPRSLSAGRDPRFGARFVLRIQPDCLGHGACPYALDQRYRDDASVAQLDHERAISDADLSSRRRDEDLRPGVRTFTVGDYVIAYRIDGDNLLILRVLRGSRDIESLFRA